MTIETANRLFELRKKHNLSQEELAEKLGVSRQAVSKWERSEASPDTDNLIALAKIYDLSLDELIYGEKEEKNEQEENKETAKESAKENDELCINIEDDGDKVHIGPKGILVEDKDGETVKIGWTGLNIEISDSNKKDSDSIDDDDENEENDGKEKVYVSGDGKVKIRLNTNTLNFKKPKFWLEVPYSIICVILYLIFGFYNICGGWGLSWIIFVTIPVYYSLVEAIYKRRMSEFAYPVLAACVYLYLGMYHGNWHPSWLVFLTIPIYYPIASIVDSGIKRVKQKKSINVE